jgi:hypothetical protein
MALPNQQVPVQSHHEVGYVCAHFDHFAETGNHDNFVILNKLTGENRRTKIVAWSPRAACHRIKYTNQTVDAVEFRVCAHVFVKVFFKVFLCIALNSLNNLPVKE